MRVSTVCMSLHYEEFYEACKIETFDKITKNIRKIHAGLNDENCKEIYKLCISAFQSKKANNGKLLEQFVESVLCDHHIPFRTQVTIDKQGFTTNMMNKCHHRLDFVIGDPNEMNIKKLIVVSCKTTCRERWTQDNWSLTFPPKLYILLTTSSDYPSRERFEENDSRIILTNKTKKRDDRFFRGDLDDLIPLLHRVLEMGVVGKK